MLWGISGLTKGMNESDARFRKKRSENIQLFKEYKSLFPDAPIEDYQKFIDETTEGSPWLKKQMPSRDALQTYVDQQDLARKRETTRIQNQTLQTDLAIGNTLTARAKELASTADNIDDVRANLLGGLEVGSDQYNRINSWVDNNGETITGAVTSAKRDLAERLAAQLKTLDPDAVRRIAKDSYGLKLNDTTVNMTLELAKQNLDEKQRVARSKIFEDYKSDPTTMKLMRSENAEDRAQGEKMLKQQFADANVPWIEANPEQGVEGSAAIFRERATADYMANSNDRQQKARITALSDPQYKDIQRSINDVTQAEAIEMLRAIIPDEGINFSEEGEIAQALLNTMMLNKDDADAKDIANGVEQAKGIPKDEDSINSWLADKPWSDRAKAQIKKQLMLTDKLETTQRTIKWQQETMSNPVVLAELATTNPAAYEASIKSLREQAKAAGLGFDENLWATFARKAFAQKGLAQKEAIINNYSKDPQFLAAVKGAATAGNQDGALREIINLVNAKGENMTQTMRREVITLLADSAELNVSNAMTSIYTTQVTQVKENALKQFTQSQKANAAKAKMDAAVTVKLFDSSLDAEEDGNVIGGLASSYATAYGATPAEIQRALQDISQTDEYKGKDGLEKLLSNFDTVVSTQIMANNKGVMPNLQARQTAFINANVNALVVKPETIKSLEEQISRHDSAFEKVRTNLMMISKQQSNWSVETFDEQKAEIIGQVKTKIGKIQRQLTGNKVIAFETLGPLQNQITALEEKLKLLERSEHPRKIEMRQQKAEEVANRQTYLLGPNPNDPNSVRAMGEKHMKAVKDAENEILAHEKRYADFFASVKTGVENSRTNAMRSNYNRERAILYNQFEAAKKAVSEYSRIAPKYLGSMDNRKVGSIPQIDIRSNTQ